MRVLIADDDRDAVMTLGILLRSEGHEVWSTQQAEEVTDAVRDFRPQIVLLDIGMPERDGYQLAEALSREHGASCPVLVAVTGRSSPAERERAQASGFHHLVAKPYDADDLLTLVALFGR